MSPVIPLNVFFNILHFFCLTIDPFTIIIFTWDSISDHRRGDKIYVSCLSILGNNMLKKLH